MNNSTATFPTIRQRECWDTDVYAVIYSLISMADMLLSLPSNAWVLYLLLRGGSLASDLFVFSLACTELFISLTVPFAIFSMFIIESPLMSEISGFCFGITIAGRPLFQCCICVERYVAVVHPIVYHKHKALRYKLVCMAGVWMVTLGFCVYYIYIWSYYSIDIIFPTVLAIDSFCSYSILQALRQPRPGDGEKEEMNLMKRRAFTTVVVIQVTVVFNYLPLTIVTIVGPLISVDFCNCLLFPYALVFSIFGNFLHSFLYIARVQKLPCCKHL